MVWFLQLLDFRLQECSITNSPLTVSHYGVQFVVVVGVLTLPLPVDRAGGAVAPAPVISPAPEVLLSPLLALLAALFPVVRCVGLDRAEVRVPPLAETAGALVTPEVRVASLLTAVSAELPVRGQTDLTNNP